MEMKFGVYVKKNGNLEIDTCNRSDEDYINVACNIFYEKMQVEKEAIEKGYNQQFEKFLDGLGYTKSTGMICYKEDE